MLHNRDRITIVPDEALQPSEIPGFQSIALTRRKGQSELFISPCRDEHWISTDLFKLRIYCDEHDITITSIGSYNQFPFYSLFSDRVIVGPTTRSPTWYCRSNKTGWLHSSNATDCPVPVEDVEHGPLRKKIRYIDDQKVIDRFTYRNVYILKSAYDRYLEAENQPPKNLFVVEAKSSGSTYAFRIEMDRQKTFDVCGLNHQFQNGWVASVGNRHYMSFQILASMLSNWQYFCCGGSSNLFCVLPMKVLFFADVCMWPSVSKIIKGCSRLRYGATPTVAGIYNCETTGDAFVNSLPQMRLFSEVLTAAPLPEIQALQS